MPFAISRSKASKRTSTPLRSIICPQNRNVSGRASPSRSGRKEWSQVAVIGNAEMAEIREAAPIITFGGAADRNNARSPRNR